ncbi:MAG: response regulator transcription factor [Elusimicrobia bacterium]|nr:response regulator transcription factor [Elusimicrobiota bacterium]MBP9127989.1 response regulator transcription factor [Elusimicrobiota bacterium]
MKRKVLVVEDDAAIAKLLAYNLEKEGYEPLVVKDGESAVALFRSRKPRLVLLDLMIPKVDGLEVCRLIRATDRSVPILMLTAKSGEVDKIVGLEMGADDYVTKPFSVREVMTRIKTLLRRTATDSPAAGAVFQAGALVLDAEKHTVQVGGETVALTGKEFDLLKTLWTARGKTLTRDDVLERVWGIDRSADIDTRTVDQHVARLRNKLGPEKKRLVTVKNVGYRFVGEP